MALGNYWLMRLRLMFSNKKFDSNVWKNFVDLRKYYVRDVLASFKFLGMTKIEIEKYFGHCESCNDVFTGCFSYFITVKENKKYYLVFYFTDGHVKRINYEYEIF